jgi:hypothetical protein
LDPIPREVLEAPRVLEFGIVALSPFPPGNSLTLLPPPYPKSPWCSLTVDSGIPRRQ